MLKEEVKKYIEKNEEISGNVIKQQTTNKKLYRDLIVKNINNIENNDEIRIVINNLKKQYTSI